MSNHFRLRIYAHISLLGRPLGNIVIVLGLTVSNIVLKTFHKDQPTSYDSPHCYWSYRTVLLWFTNDQKKNQPTQVKLLKDSLNISNSIQLLVGGSNPSRKNISPPTNQLLFNYCCLSPTINHYNPLKIPVKTEPNHWSSTTPAATKRCASRKKPPGA